MGIEVTKDEADKRPFDGTALTNMDPNKRYRWARQDSMAIARHQYNGYDFVDKTTDKVRSIVNEATRMKKGADTSTSIELGDMVLMSTSKENHERLERERLDKVKRQTQGVTAAARNAIRAASRGSGHGRDLSYEEHEENERMKG